MYSSHAGSCILNTFAVESNGTLDWYPWTALHWHFGWHLTLNWHLGQESTNFPSMYTSRSTLGWLSTKHLSSVNQDVNEVSIECWPIDWLFIVCWSRCQLTLAHNAFSTHDFPCTCCVKYMYLVLFRTANHVWGARVKLCYYYCIITIMPGCIVSIFPAPLTAPGSPRMYLCMLLHCIWYLPSRVVLTRQHPLAVWDKMNYKINVLLAC